MSPIIPHRDGSILYLPDALKRYPTAGVVLLCRVSEPAQVANGSLARQRDLEIREHRNLGCRLQAIIAGQERGKLSEMRPHLRRAIQLAKTHSAILSTRDLTRLIRAEAFDHCQNWHAQPTREEIKRLLELADGVPLATRLPPKMSAAELHYQATVGGMNKRPGRKSAIESDPMLAMVILELFEWGEDTSLRKIAECCGVTLRMVQRFIDKWKGYQSPTNAYRRTMRDKAKHITEREVSPGDP